jgi:predicted dehydrogenase
MDWLEGFRVHGEGGSVEVRSFLPFTGRASEVRIFDSGVGEYRSPLTPDTDSYERQVEAFGRAIRDDQPVTPDIHDGMADLKILHAIIESVNTNRWIEIEPRQVATQ